MGDRQIAETLRRLLFFSFFALGDGLIVDCIFFFYDLLVCQFQIIPYYPSEFNLLFRLFFFLL